MVSAQLSEGVRSAAENPMIRADEKAEVPSAGHAADFQTCQKNNLMKASLTNKINKVFKVLYYKIPSILFYICFEQVLK